MKAGVSGSQSNIAPVYLHKCTLVKRSLAPRLGYEGYALLADVVNRDREAVREFLIEAARYAGTDLSGLARMAGIAPSTLTRFVNGDAKHIPTTRTLSKIAQVSGYSFPVIGGWDRSELLKLLRKVAAAAGIDLNEAAVFNEAEEDKLRRASEWLTLLRGLTPPLQDHVLDMLRGMNEALAAQQDNGNPSKMVRRRRQG